MPVVRNSEELDINYIIQLTDIKFYDDFFPKKIASKKYELIRISTDNLTIKLIDKNQKDLLSIVHGKIMVYKNIEYFEIIGTY